MASSRTERAGAPGTEPAPPATDPHPGVVTVVKQKLHGGRACWQAYRLGADEDGDWLFTPGGSLFRSSSDGVEAECEVEGGGGPGPDSLILVPAAEQRWLATWSSPARELRISVEICVLVRRDPGVVMFLDWELDPFRLRSGLTAVEDLDDFVEASTAGLLTVGDAELALATAARVERALRRRTAPFDARGDRRLADAAGLQLAPLVDVPHPRDL